jgi:hypothetical protein
MFRSLFLAFLFVASVAGAEVPGAAPYVGRWALTLPGGGAGWLGITDEGTYLDGGILWGGGSVNPIDSLFMVDGGLIITRIHEVERKNAQGQVVRKQRYAEQIRCVVEGDKMHLSRFNPGPEGQGVAMEELEGKRIPDLPPAPDLSKLKMGEPIQLFNGSNLEGWKPTSTQQTNGWSARDGILVNDARQEEGKPHVDYTNLRTVREFEDFNLKLEVNVGKDGNSGVYLRGVYESQVMDSFGEPLDPHHMGAIYSRITPTAAAEKPAGQWQTMDITLCDRHVTVVLNGTKIIDNQPLLGCTGGALTSDEFIPGPIYLQGDHTSVSYRNLVLTPILK